MQSNFIFALTKFYWNSTVLSLQTFDFSSPFSIIHAASNYQSSEWHYPGPHFNKNMDFSPTFCIYSVNHRKSPTLVFQGIKYQVKYSTVVSQEKSIWVWFIDPLETLSKFSATKIKVKQQPLNKWKYHNPQCLETKLKHDVTYTLWCCLLDILRTQKRRNLKLAQGGLEIIISG